MNNMNCSDINIQRHMHILPPVPVGGRKRYIHRSFQMNKLLGHSELIQYGQKLSLDALFQQMESDTPQDDIQRLMPLCIVKRTNNKLEVAVETDHNIKHYIFDDIFI